MKIGIVDRIFYDEYLSEHICPSCKQNFSTKLVIHCKAFATGMVWWAWNKQGYTECTGCGAIYDVKTTPAHSRGVRSAFSLKSLPFYYFLPTVLIGGIGALLLLGLIAGAVIGMTTTTQDRFEGIWAGKTDNSTLFVLNDHEYTFINNDTIVFGTYRFDRSSDRIHIMIQGQPNDIEKLDGNKGIQLHVAQYEYASFSKAVSGLRGRHPYSREYNHWRIKARHHESDAEIKERVLGYLYYLRLRYQWALHNNLTYLPAELYSPILMAQNGIAIRESSMQRWRPVFYSDDNWKTANAFLHKTFPRGRKYNEEEPNAYIRNLEGIEYYIENVENEFKK